MDLGIYTWFGFSYSFSDIIKLIKEAGFQYVMTWWGDEFENFTGPKEQHPGIIRKTGLKLENVHFPFEGVNDIWEDTTAGQETFDRYCSYIDDCKTYEIPTAVVHTTSGDYPPPYSQLGLDRFKRLIEKAEKNNVNIALENVRKPEYMDNIFKNIKSDRLKFCYDSGHENCFTPGLDFLAKYGDKLAALHLHDNDGASDQHLLPFMGNVKWERIMAHLKRLEYKGPLAFEIDSQFIDVSKEYTAFEYLSEAVKRASTLLGFN